MRIVPHLGAVHAALVARVFRRNLVGITLFEFTWGLGCPFGMYGTIVPAYLTALGAPKSRSRGSAGIASRSYDGSHPAAPSCRRREFDLLTTPETAP